MKIVILGCGIGGLTVAHELSKIPEFDIVIYEKNDIPGGQARGIGDKHNYYEYCWHAIGNGYVNLINILKEINTSTGTVYDNLVPAKKYWYYYYDKLTSETDRSFLTTFKNNDTQPISLIDRLYFYILWIFANILPKHVLNSYQSITWYEFSMKFIPNHLRRWFVDSTSIYMGMDYKKLDAYTILKLLRTNNISEFKDVDFMFLDGPMNKVWFDPWVKQLKDKGVTFYFNTKVDKIILNNEETGIKSIITSKGEILADVFINSMDIHNLANLYSTECFTSLARNSYQLQEQISLYYDKKIYIKNVYKRDVQVFILPDSPWFLMVRHDGVLYSLEDTDILAVGIGIWDTPGEFVRKECINCTPDEIYSEVIYQLKKYFPVLVYENGDPISTPMYYKNWYPSDKNIDEPKFSNNINTLIYRPVNRDSNLSNLYHSNGYVRTNMNIYCMESAVEAGIKTASKIIKDKLGYIQNEKIIPREYPGIFNTIQNIVSYII